MVETPTFALTAADTADPVLAAGYFGAWFLYFAFAASQFYAGSRSWTAFKAGAAVILSQALTVALVMLFLFLTTRANGS